MKIQVVTLITDNQDGGFTASVYNNTDELIADHSRVQDGLATAEEVLSGDPFSEYENGYVGRSTIEISEDGKIKPFFFHGGQ